MEQDSVQHSFTQSDLDSVRSISDDGNPIHDPSVWCKVQNNPFDGPIVLGFQLVELAARATSDTFLNESRYKASANSAPHSGVYSRYRVTFLNAVLPNVNVEMKASPVRKIESEKTLRQRFVARSAGNIVLKGYRETVVGNSENTDYMFSGIDQGERLGSSSAQPDGEVMITETQLLTTHARRFAKACGDSVHQNNVHGLRGLASDIYPVSMTSGALVRYAINSGWDLCARPLVYRSQDIRIDSSRLNGLSGNTAISLQTRRDTSHRGTQTNEMGASDFAFVCTGTMSDGSVLFCVRLVVSALGNVPTLQQRYRKRTELNAIAF